MVRLAVKWHHSHRDRRMAQNHGVMDARWALLKSLPWEAAHPFANCINVQEFYAHVYASLYVLWGILILSLSTYPHPKSTWHFQPGTEPPPHDAPGTPFLGRQPPGSTAGAHTHATHDAAAAGAKWGRTAGGWLLGCRLLDCSVGLWWQDWLGEQLGSERLG